MKKVYINTNHQENKRSVSFQDYKSMQATNVEITAAQSVFVSVNELKTLLSKNPEIITLINKHFSL